MTTGYGSLTKNIVRFILNLLVRNLLAGVIIYCCWIPIANYHYWFTWHVLLCTLGILPLMSEALLLFAGDELWSRQLTRKQKYWIHGGLISFGTLLYTAGTIDIIYYTEAGAHFNTAHGITGLISMILVLFSIIFGICANYSQALRSYARPITIKFAHNFVGILGFFIGIISLCFAYYTHWFQYFTSQETRLAALIATILGTVWILSTALVSGYDQIKTIFW